MAYSIADLVEHTVDAVPERLALTQDDRTRTYAQLETRANQLAHHLQSVGVQPGDKVALYSRNTIEAVETMVAIFKARAVMINVNFRYVAAELRYLLENSDAVAVVVERRYLPVVAATLPDTPLVRAVVVVEDGTDSDAPELPGVDVIGYEDALAAQSAERDFGERSGDDVYMLYTGGTTGAPKGVMWRHEDVFMVLGGGIDFMTGEPVADEYELARKAVDAGPLVSFPLPPLIHGGAQWAILIALFAGRQVVVEPDFEPDKVWANIARHKVNLMFLTGDAMARPIIHAWDPERHDGSTLFYIGSSAALFSPSVKEQFLDAFPNALISDSIGASETGFAGMAKAERGEISYGGPRVHVDGETVVLDADDKPVEPGSGVVGKLARRGHIPLGYYKDEEKTAATFRLVDGVRHAIPGDDALVEADGTVVMLGRGSTTINTGGEKVHPEEVEGALKAHPAVYDALVIGVPHERMGTAVAAVVSLWPGAEEPTIEQLNEVAREHVARYKCPRHVWFEPEIRRNPAGKPDYKWARGVTESRPHDDHQEIRK